MRAAIGAGAEVIAPIALHLRGPVRDHYLDWLAGARPELLEPTRRLYRGAYQPSAARDVLSERVRELVDKHGGRERRELAVVVAHVGAGAGRPRAGAARPPLTGR